MAVFTCRSCSWRTVRRRSYAIDPGSPTTQQASTCAYSRHFCLLTMQKYAYNEILSF